MISSPISLGRQLTSTALYGIATLALYALLYIFEDRFLKVSSQGGWYFIIPVATAFIFSFAHGAFTGRFWDLLGIKAKK